MTKFGDELKELPKAVADLIKTACESCVSFPGSMAYYFRDDRETEGQIEIWIEPMTMEIVGGKVDGERGIGKVSFDLKEILDSFKKIDSIEWFQPNFDCPPCVDIEGEVGGETILMHLLREPYSDDEVERVEASEVFGSNP